MQKRLTRTSAIAVLLLAACLYLPAQLLEVPLAKRMANASLVVEGEVVSSHSYYGNDRNIYSSHLVRIDKVMKGQPASDTLEIILRGGTVGKASTRISHYLSLGPKSSGVFFLNPLGTLHPAKLGKQMLAYDVYSGLQGFIAYRAQPGRTVAAEPFHLYKSIEFDLYPLLGWTSGAAPVKHQPVPMRTQGSPIIDSIRPLEVTAGTRTTLSIYGHGFQAAKGTVIFADAEIGGGGNYMFGDSTDVQEWSDTLVKVWVPSAGPLPFLEGTAGTGPVIIQNVLLDTASSTDVLNVSFAIGNVRDEDSLSQIGLSRFATLFDQDSYAANDTIGGYTFHCTNSFSSTNNAEAVFRQAIRQWRCATGVNFKIGADTSLNLISKDLVNLIRWDDFPDTLPFGVLAYTEISFDACEDVAEKSYLIVDVDFTFGRNLPWNFDTTANPPNKVDFYSVALHEIGHAHGLNHVIENADVMDFNIGFGQRIGVLTAHTLDGAQWMIDSSTIARGTCPGPMTLVAANDCNLLPLKPQVSTTIDLHLFPNPTNDAIHIQILEPNAHRRFGFHLFDANGKSMSAMQYTLHSTSSNAWTVDLNDLPSGLYFARIQYGAAYANHKIVLIK